jgi:2-polyprenyl-6-methoxyphenol hydroxylase-like FAD-dependent oxidoreductase
LYNQEARKKNPQGFARMRVIIIGAGLGGLCLAQGLRKSGVEVVVFEKQKSKEENKSGYGIHIDPKGKRALRHCLPHDLWTKFLNTSTQAGTKILFRDPQLRVLAERDDADISKAPVAEMERRGIGRDAFRNILLTGLTDGASPVVRWNKAFTFYEHCSDGRVRVHFEDGTTVTGDVLVGADGPHSPVRKEYLPQIERVELGINTIAGRCVLDESSFYHLPPDFVDGSLNNIVPHGKGWMFASCWDLPTTSGAKAQRHIVWAYVLPQHTILGGMTPSSGQLQQLVADRIRTWSPALVQIVQNTDPRDISCIPLRTMPYLEDWTASNVTVLGDAIHNMTPMAGMGANTALRDAEVLTSMLADAASGTSSVVSAIGAYEHKMRGYANAVVSLSRRNAMNASSGKKIERLMFRGLLHLAQTSPFVMRQTLGRSVAPAT